MPEATADILIYTHPDCAFSAAAKADYPEAKFRMSKAI